MVSCLFSHTNLSPSFCILLLLLALIFIIAIAVAKSIGDLYEIDFFSNNHPIIILNAHKIDSAGLAACVPQVFALLAADYLAVHEMTSYV